MEKKIFEESFSEKLNANFSRQAKYFEFDFEIFQELGSSVFEINKCLIFEFYRASITLTNHVLERLLKIALIYNEAGIGPIPTTDWTSIFEGPNRKYSTISLANSIELCRKNDLITAEEKEYLFNTVRILMRNGFSHAYSSQILSSFPDDSSFFQGSFSNPEEIKRIVVNQKVVPFMQAIQMDNFAKENSSSYFDYIFELTLKIESRILDRNKQMT